MDRLPPTSRASELSWVAIARQIFKDNPYDPLKEAVEDPFDNDYTYAEALVEYAQAHDLDIDEVAEMVSLMPDLLVLVSREATNLHFV
jgi:hypothetical protein